MTMYIRRATPVNCVQYDGSAESAQRCDLIQPYPACAALRGILADGGYVPAHPMDWIITDTDGSRRVMADVAFHREYEEVDLPAIDPS